jgi:hypothetical protein
LEFDKASGFSNPIGRYATSDALEDVRWFKHSFPQESWKNCCIACFYVDDTLITGNNEVCIASIKKEMKKGFEMTYMGHIQYYSSIEVS